MRLPWLQSEKHPLNPNPDCCVGTWGCCWGHLSNGGRCRVSLHPPGHPKWRQSHGECYPWWGRVHLLCRDSLKQNGYRERKADCRTPLVHGMSSPQGWKVRHHLVYCLIGSKLQDSAAWVRDIKSKTPQTVQMISVWLDHFSSERGGTSFTPLSQMWEPNSGLPLQTKCSCWWGFIQRPAQALAHV